MFTYKIYNVKGCIHLYAQVMILPTIISQSIPINNINNLLPHSTFLTKTSINKIEYLLFL